MEILKFAVVVIIALFAQVGKVNAQEDGAGLDTEGQGHEFSYDETHARVSSMFEIILDESDLAAFRDHMVSTLRPHSDKFGVSPDLLEKEVVGGMDRVISVIQESPKLAADEIAHILLDIEMHMPRN